VWGLTPGDRTERYGFEPFIISSLRLCRRLLTATCTLPYQQVARTVPGTVISVSPNGAGDQAGKGVKLAGSAVERTARYDFHPTTPETQTLMPMSRTASR
jgi:hypothetical protein